jgi:chorismate mutase
MGKLSAPADSAGVRVFRGIRGAITTEGDDTVSIARATKRLLAEMTRRNEVDLDDIASVLFTVTPDLRACFPALAAREMGWISVPMLHACEIDVPGALGRCIRVLMHVNTTRRATEIEHVYLDGATVLRPDLMRTTTS